MLPEFFEFFTDSTSTKTDDFFTHPSPEWDEVWTSEPATDQSDYLKCVCKVCHKNTVDVRQESSEGRRKRRKVEADAIPSTLLVCSNCLNLTALQDLPEKSVLLLKRAQAKRKTQESKALQKVKEDEAEVQSKTEAGSGQDSRRLKQMMRNRQSAQLSRDRKKAYTNELELQVNTLQEENTKLRERVLALEHENSRLRGHSARQAFSSDAQMSRMGAVSLVLGAFLAVCLIASLVQPVPTVNLKPMGRHLLSMTAQPDDFSEAYQPASSEDSHALALPNQQML
jgi:hypothetical protein